MYNDTVLVEASQYSGDDVTQIKSALEYISLTAEKDRINGRSRKYKLQLENREYRLNEMIAIRNASYLEFEGNGASLVWTELMDAIKVFDSENVDFSNFSIDYDPLPFTQGIITSVENQNVKVKIDCGYRTDADTWLDQNREITLHVHDPRTGGFMEGYNHEYYIGNVHEAGDSVLTMELLNDYDLLTPKVGDLVSIKQNCFGTVGISGSKNVTFSNVNIYSAPFFAFYEVNSDGGTVFNRFNIVPGPRPEGATRNRVRTSNGDGSHFQSVRQGPIMENCVITHCGDDCVNAHGFFYRVVDVKDTEVVLTLKMDSPLGVGDTICAYEKDSYAEIAQAKILEFERFENDSLNKVCDEIWRGIIFGYTQGVLYRLKLDRSIPDLKQGDHISSVDRIASKAVIRNSVFGYNRAHGIVLKGHDVCIEDNLVTNCTHAGIRVISDLGWAESGIPTNAVIRRNTLVNCIVSAGARQGGSIASIAVTMDSYENGFRKCYENKNIVIEDNVVIDSAAYGIFASNCTNLTVRNNRIVGPFKIGINRQGEAYGLNPCSGILIGMAKGVAAEQNTVIAFNDSITEAVEVHKTCSDVICSKNTLIK